MPLNAWLAIAATLAVIASPLIVLASPLWITWLWFQRREKRARGLRVLLPIMADTASRYGEAMVRGVAPGGDGWRRVGSNLDRYVASTPHNPRWWRLPLLLLAMEFAPWLVLRPRFSKLDPAGRRAFVDRYLTTTAGLFGVFSLVRQAIRLAYYADPEVHASLGYHAPRLPRRARRVRPVRRVTS